MLACVTVRGAVNKKAPVNKQVPISTVQERKSWLNVCSNFLKEVPVKISDSNNLFIYEEVNLENDKVAEPVISKEEPKRTDELVILQKVGEAIKPEGHVVVNGKVALFLHGSRIVTTQTVLKARTKDQTFRITIKSITKKQFTLQLNNNTLVFNY